MALSKSFSDFPDEVLVKLQDCLKKGNQRFSEDLRNLTLASKEFDRISHPAKPVWLMRKVFPELFKYISKKDIFNLRLVCQDWRDATNEYLGDQWNLQPFNGSKSQFAVKPRCHKFTPLILKGLKDEVRLKLPAEILDFVEKTEDHAGNGRNPVLTRSLAFSPVIPVGQHWGFEDMALFWELALELLQKFGRHVHYLLINNDSFRPTSTFLHDVLRRVLQLCPNLRSLEVTGKAFEYVNRFHRNEELVIMAQNPLPPLPQLEFLFSSLKVVLTERRRKVECVSSPLSDVLYSTYGHQVKRLGIVARDLEWIAKENQELDKLTELNLAVNGLSNLKLMEALSLPTVGKLTLSGKLQLNELFELLRTFPDLKVLDLGCLVVDDDGDDDISSVFPVPSSLCTISLNLGRGHNHSFLMNFRFLQLRYLNLTYDLGTTQKSEIQEGSSVTVEHPFKLSECVVAGTLSTCPIIWNHFQKLKEIHVTEVKGCVTRKVYTRERFEFLKKKN